MVHAENRPQIEVELTFFGPDEGGRSSLWETMEGYRPHFVVEDPSQPQPEVSDDTWLGVEFLPSGSPWQFGIPQRTGVTLLYFPSVDYGRLAAGAEFTVREGPFVVGRGRVVHG